MPSHTKAEQEKNKKKKEKGGSAIGRAIQSLLPGQLGRGLFGKANEKIKKELEKKKK